ncbi:MraY family glycosyltransferase [Microvirga rosea]|uniref:MraY family glycosyltransferase n=1 Tax=Microvirga rosea TaxID=2715425 RepID=UPI001D0B4A42|nr:glycosyltransferase family 4 protein [Microvirga rosea]MCB8819340.1 glycosyltransferase family 4 protein [Microvirga rosea]
MLADHSLLGIPAAALLTVILILVLRPLLVRYALARPNARSSHKTPTPQGGGIAIMAAVLIVVIAGAVFSPWAPECACADMGLRGLLSFHLSRDPVVVVLGAATLLALVGACDDIRPLPAVPRLILQFLAVFLVVMAAKVRLLPDIVPFWLETTILIVGGVWFVNLVNFMDGLDWITVAEMVPITAFLTFLGLHVDGPFAIFTLGSGPLLASALCGALLGFAVFNKPVARLFLGDVGSLPIGLMVGWLLLMLARNGAFAAGLLLPLYYLMDATITLLRRLARGEKVWEAHRSHFYQKATDNGFSALAVSAHVFCLNLVLAGLAAITLVWPAPAVQLPALAAGLILVGLMLRHFSRPRPEFAR